VGKPQVVVREVDGVVHEPMEILTVDIPEEYLGGVTQLMASRKGIMENMVNNGTGWVRIDFKVPARGLIGFRTRFLTETPGAGYAPWTGNIVYRSSGSIISDRAGVATPYSMINLQERAAFFIQPGAEVYEGMVLGENSRNEDMDVNIVREKKQTNVRAASSDNFEGLTPPRTLTLEESLE